VVVFDVNKRSSFESALSIILEHKKLCTIDHVGSKMPIMLVGMKTDLSTDITPGNTKNKKRIICFVTDEEQRNRAERYNVTLNVRLFDVYD
jgi:GTPase SAR1 family protein